MTIPQLFEKCRQTVVQPENHKGHIPLDEYLQGDVVECYDCVKGDTRMTVSIFPNTEVLLIEYKGVSMCIEYDMLKYRIVFPVSRKFFAAG